MYPDKILIYLTDSDRYAFYHCVLSNNRIYFEGYFNEI